MELREDNLTSQMLESGQTTSSPPSPTTAGTGTTTTAPAVPLSFSTANIEVIAESTSSNTDFVSEENLGIIVAVGYSRTQAISALQQTH